MALFPATQFKFDGGLPYSEDGTADASGVFHGHKIKRGSTGKVRFEFPALSDVDDYFWVAHFRTTATAVDVQLLLRSRAGTFTTPAGYNPQERSGIDRINATTIELDFDADETRDMNVQGNGSWDLEAWEWVDPVTPIFGAILTKDRAIEGTFAVTQDTTREGDNQGDVGA
jgi:hypothetical protein